MYAITAITDMQKATAMTEVAKSQGVSVFVVVAQNPNT